MIGDDMESLCDILRGILEELIEIRETLKKFRGN
jgi:hypothetical protein